MSCDELVYTVFQRDELCTNHKDTLIWEENNKRESKKLNDCDTK